MNYVVLDLEMCKVKKKEKEQKLHSEVIQIGAVLVDEHFEIQSQFNRYVKPEVGHVDSFITNLTGITDATVKNAANFETVMKEFWDWVPADSILVSWSYSDRKQLLHEYGGKDMESEHLQEVAETWMDCQKMFGERLNSNRSRSLEEALIITDIWQAGRAHDGLNDAYNTALLFIKLMTEPNLKFNDIYEEASREETTHLSFSLGNLFAGLGFDMTDSEDKEN